MVTIQNPERLLTVDEFWKVYADKPYELVDGEVIEVSPAGGEAPEVNLLLGGKVATYVTLKKLGKVTGAEGGYWITPTTLRAPDIAFYTWEKHKLHIERDKYRPFPPDFAVEVVSPTDSSEDVQRKVDQYLEAGVKLVWVVYPQARKIIASHPDGTSKTYKLGDTITGENVITGLEIVVDECFPPPEPEDA